VQAYGENNFQILKNFTKSLILSFDISSGSTRVGVIVYSTNSTVAFKLDQYSSYNEVEEAIDTISYPGGGTYTGKALNKAAIDLYSDAVVRENVPKVLVVITDGVSTDAVTQPAALLNDSGVLVYVVAIGQNVDHTQLTEIAHCETEHVFTAEFHSLGIVINDVRGAICRGTDYSYHKMHVLSQLLTNTSLQSSGVLSVYAGRSVKHLLVSCSLVASLLNKA